MIKSNFISRRNLFCIPLLCIALFFAFISSSPSLYASDRFIVSTTDDLQQLINAAPTSSTIIVMEGSYSGPITINHSISVMAEEGKKVQIVNDSEEPALTINAPKVTLSGLVIKDENIKSNPTIQVLADHSSLINLHILTGSDGIAAKKANDGTIQHSTIEWADNSVSRANRGNGIDLYDSHSWTITESNISNMHDGIYLERSNHSIISDSTIESSRYGFHFMYTSNSELHNNIGKMNVTGAMIMASENITVKQNSFYKQVENLNSQGILFYDTHFSIIENNIVDGNRVGLYIEQSNNNEFIKNQISNNFVGFQWLDSSDNNVMHNTLVGNVSDVQNRGVSENNITMNYWESFKGIDTDGDLLSNIAYSINPFFFGLIQKKPTFQVFFQSPGMQFLEGLYSVDRDSWMTDSNPKMTPALMDESSGTLNNPIDTLIISIILLIFSTIIIYKSRRNVK